MTTAYVPVILLSIAVMLIGYSARKSEGWVIFTMGLFALLIQIGVLTHILGR